jgi:hypothetical protein
MSHVRIGLTSGTTEEVGDRAWEPDGMLSAVRGQPGFKAHGLVETQGGKPVAAERAGQANELAASWVKENLADLQLQSARVFSFYETA